MAEAKLPVENLGKYRLIEQIGQGGMATVFKAADTETGWEVAVKVMSPVMAQDSQFTKRFKREAEVVMRLKHPHIVPVVDFGQDAGYAYLVMPLLEVGSLADKLKLGPLTPSEGGMLVDQLGSALEFAHEQGVIHRDVKPSNVLLDDKGNALLADFGLARIHDASVSLTGSALLGTPAYMSPEQARGEKASPASDQYSLGVILFQLCTGELPFQAETPMAVMLKHINEPIPLARLRSPNVPEAIERVILKATAKNPAERFGSMGEMNSAFQSALAHAQDPFNNPAPDIEVPPSSIAASIMVHEPEPLKRKRSRLLRVAAAAAVLLLLLLACPVAASGLMEMLDGAANPAEGSSLTVEDMSGPQLTALAGTIEALSTQLAAAGGDETQSPEQIQTAVMATLAGDFEVLGELEGTATPLHSATPGPSPTATKTFTAGPSPTASKTPTKTKTPTPGPSPTPSRTPTITYTPSPGPSPTATRTPIPSKTPTPSPFPSSTPFPSPTFNPTGTTTAVMTPPPTIESCSGIEFTGLGAEIGGAIVWGDIFNGSPSRIEIQEIYLEWPQENGFHQKFDLAGDEIWDTGNPFPPTMTGFLDSGNRKIDSGDTKKLVGVFDTVQPGDYHLGVMFTDGCWIEGWP
ncbi:MAG: protein kinase [Chloroflexi bacterium]|nr:protein kinase [Chloroflexota bacterium]